MNASASLLSHLVADYSTPPTFVDRTFGEALFHTESEVLAINYAPDVTLWTDGGGKVRQAMRPIIGAEKVARWRAGASKRPYEGGEISSMTAEVVEINGAPCLVLSGDGRTIATLTVDLDADGRIVTIHNVANPDKLHAIADGVTRS